MTSSDFPTPIDNATIAKSMTALWVQLRLFIRSGLMTLAEANAHADRKAAEWKAI